jgi:hypothetical protein
LAVSLDLKTFSLEGGSFVVISALKTPTLSQDWHINSGIATTIASLRASSSWIARKVHLSANFFTHHVIFWARQEASRAAFPFSFPLIPLPLLLSPFIVGRIPLLLMFLLVLLVPRFEFALYVNKKKKKGYLP